MENFTEQEKQDIKRALIIAMQTLDATRNADDEKSPQDVSLSNRLELITAKFMEE